MYKLGCGCRQAVWAVGTNPCFKKTNTLQRAILEIIINKNVLFNYVVNFLV
jgi:hypothetical protein